MRNEKTQKKLISTKKLNLFLEICPGMFVKKSNKSDYSKILFLNLNICFASAGSGCRGTNRNV